jgi:hypothetical protein
VAEQQEIVVLVIFEVPEGQIKQVFDDIVAFADKVISPRPGFISSHIHQSLDGRRMFEYARWASFDHFRAAMTDPVVREAVMTISRYKPNTTFGVPIAAIWADGAS